MSPPIEISDLFRSQALEETRRVGESPLELSASEQMVPPSFLKRQGPPRRVIILTTHHPTSRRNSFVRVKPNDGDEVEEAVIILKDRQC